MSAPNKTAIILVHGAWHTPSHLEGLAEPLRKDFLVDAPALDTSGPADVVRSKGLQDNVAAVLKMIQPHLDAGREVVIVAHSAGGVTVPEAVAGNTVQERRAKGLDGGVKAVIFIASLLVLPGGISLAEQAGRMPSEPWYETVVSSTSIIFPNPLESDAEKLERTAPWCSILAQRTSSTTTSTKPRR